MKCTILTTILLGLCLAPALADKNKFSKKIPIPGGSQILTINKEWRVATVEQKSSSQGSWKSIWNYDTGFMASKVLPERACYISIMDRKKMPNFDALPKLADQNGLKGHGHASMDITFTLIKRPIRDLKSYGPDIFTMCKGLPTYVAYEYQGSQNGISSCRRLDALHLLGLKYCHANIKA